MRKNRPGMPGREKMFAITLLLLSLEIYGGRLYTHSVSIELKNEAQGMLNWVQQCPAPSDLRVYLSPTLSRQSPSLHRNLLALGCTVTMRLGNTSR
ncbi:hypothetical protein HYS30_03765 [Candidatus Peregrinibacteria bacterium]|nr:hypothetical protein [Candidatus Peregrinibacteria bacterium]